MVKMSFLGVHWIRIYQRLITGGRPQSRQYRSRHRTSPSRGRLGLPGRAITMNGVRLVPPRISPESREVLGTLAERVTQILSDIPQHDADDEVVDDMKGTDSDDVPASKS